jgi:hypothetical protein
MMKLSEKFCPGYCYWFHGVDGRGLVLACLFFFIPFEKEAK